MTWIPSSSPDCSGNSTSQRKGRCATKCLITISFVWTEDGQCAAILSSSLWPGWRFGTHLLHTLRQPRRSWTISRTLPCERLNASSTCFSDTRLSDCTTTSVSLTHVYGAHGRQLLSSSKSHCTVSALSLLDGRHIYIMHSHNVSDCSRVRSRVRVGTCSPAHIFTRVIFSLTVQPSYDSITYNLTYRRRRRINHKHTNYKTKYPILDSLQITSHVTQCSTKPTAEPTLLQQWIFTCGRRGYETV